MLNSPIELLMPTPVHLLAILLVFTVVAFRQVRHSRLHRFRWLLFLLTAWTWVAATPVFAHWLGWQLEKRHAEANVENLPREPLIIVLASGEPFERAAPDGLQLDFASVQRTLTALDVWRARGGTLVFSGSAYPGEAQSIAARMAKLAVANGVPRTHIRLEQNSYSTFQNLQNTFALPGIDEHRLVLVTSALHMPRALSVAAMLGRRPAAVAADFRSKRELGWRAWLPNASSLPLLRLVLHEWIGWGWYELRGWT